MCDTLNTQPHSSTMLLYISLSVLILGFVDRRSLLYNLSNVGKLHLPGQPVNVGEQTYLSFNNHENWGVCCEK